MGKKKLFSKEHVWVELEKTSARLGISAYAVKQLGNIMFLNLPEVGETLIPGEKWGDVESVKNVSDLISPVAGKVVGINEDAIDEPESMCTIPEEIWLVEAILSELPTDLMEEETYKRYTDGL